MTNGNDEETRYAWARRPPVGGEPPSRYDEEPAAPGTTSPLSTEATTPQPVTPAPTAPQPLDPPAAAQPTPPPAVQAPTAPAGYGSSYQQAPGWTSPQATAVQDRPAPPAPPAPPSGFGPFGGPGYPAAGTEPQNRPEYSLGAPTPPGPPNTPGGEVPRPREPRRPGWGGVVGVGVGAALLSSLLTAGLIAATTDNTTTAASSSDSDTQVSAPVTTSTAENPDWTAVAAAVEPSVVAVTVSSQSASGEGSGVILSKSGEILTNNHVATGAGSNASIGVVLSDGREYEASVVGTDSRTDLAVIKIKNPPSDLTPATLGSSSAVKAGDPVMAVGNPLGMQNTVTTGIVSNTDAPVTTSSSESEQQDQNPFGGGSSSSASEQVYTNAIQTDAAINPGNSGGALVDAQGRVIGIPSSIASLGSSSMGSSESGSIGIGFAIPIDEAKTVADQLAKGQAVKHSYLGVSLADDEVQVDGATREAAILKQVSNGGPADKAGLKVNDAIIAVDGDAVNSYASLVGQLQERQPGTSVTLTVVRDGKSQKIAVTLGTRPTSSS